MARHESRHNSHTDSDVFSRVSLSSPASDALSTNRTTSAMTSDEAERVGLLAGYSMQVDKEERPRAKGSSWYESVFLVVNAALGAGLLNFPAAYDKSGGLAVAISVQGFLLIFVVISLLVLIHCSDVHQSATYQEVVHSLCGPSARLLCSALIAIYCFGTCITFFIIIGDQWDKFFTLVAGDEFCHKWYLNRRFIIPATALIFVLPLCFSRRIDFLKYASYFGFVAVLYCVILVSVKYFVGENHPGEIRRTPRSWTDVFAVVPVICFSYQCHLSVVPIYSCMERRTVPEFTKTVLIALGLCLFAYTGTASFGYLTFGSNVNEDILLSYNHTADIMVAVVLVAVKMYTTYPILAFIGRSAVISVWTSARRLEADVVVQGEPVRRVLVSLLWFLSSLLLAVIVPNIGVVIAFLGALAAIFVFDFPGLCLIQLVLHGHIDAVRHRVRCRVALVCGVFLVVVGAFFFGIILTQSIMEDVDGTQHMTRSPCYQ